MKIEKYNTSEPFKNFLEQHLNFKIDKPVNPYKVNILANGNKEYNIIPLENNFFEFIEYKISPVSALRFGCELELCFETKTRGHWFENIVNFIKETLLPNLDPKFIERFPFIFITNYHASSGRLFSLVDGDVVTKYYIVDEYKTLNISRDASVECGDGSVAEIITPVLDNVEDVKLIFENLTQYSYTNETAGFHINVSGIDNDGQVLKISRGMLYSLIDFWLSYEDENYKTARGVSNNPFSSKLINKYYNKDIFYWFKSFNPNLTYKKYLEQYGLGYDYLIDYINNFKYNSFTNYKQNNVIEFRMFKSDLNVENLISRVNDCLRLFKKAINYYFTNFKTIVKMMSNYNFYPMDPPQKIKLMDPNSILRILFDVVLWFNAKNQVTKMEKIKHGEALVVTLDSYYLYQVDKEGNYFNFRKPVKITDESAIKLLELTKKRLLNDTLPLSANK